MYDKILKQEQKLNKAVNAYYASMFSPESEKLREKVLTEQNIFDRMLEEFRLGKRD